MAGGEPVSIVTEAQALAEGQLAPVPPSGTDLQRPSSRSCDDLCRLWSLPLRAPWTKDQLLFRMREVPWRAAFGEPSALLSRCTGPRGFLLLRFLILSTWFAVFVWSLSVNSSLGYWMIYLTHWTIIAQFAYFAFAALTTAIAVLGTRQRDATPWFARVTFVLQPINLIAAFGVTLLYWSLVYEHVEGVLPSALNVLVHGGGLILALVDLLAIQTPMHLSHFCVALLYGFIYLLFSGLYHSAGGRNPGGGSGIYDALDWGKPSAAIRLCALVLFALLPALWIVVYTMFLLRRCHRELKSGGANLNV